MTKKKQVRKRVEPPCALCLRELLLSESHIIPDFFYRPIKREKQRMRELSTDPNHKRIKGPLTGVYERLLCADCEKRTQTWDDYASKILFGGTPFSVAASPFGYLFQGINYSLFKLFQLSLLWRASVSRRPEFKAFSVGEKNQKGLRDMLLHDDPGEPCDYGCLVCVNRSRLDITSDMVMMPLCQIENDSGTCIFLMGGLFWLFSVPVADAQAEQYKFILTRQGEMTVVHEERATERFLIDFAIDVKRAGNLPVPTTE